MKTKKSKKLFKIKHNVEVFSFDYSEDIILPKNSYVLYLDEEKNILVNVGIFDREVLVRKCLYLNKIIWVEEAFMVKVK